MRKKLWLTLLISFVVRIALVMYYTPRNSWSGDPGDYLRQGKQLAETGSYLQQPARDKMPGMAALVALGGYWKEAGYKYVPLIIITILNVAGATGLWWLLLPSLSEKAKFPALLLLHFGIMELLMCCFRLVPDVLAICLAIGAVCLLVKATTSSPIAYCAAAGIALGISLYFRPDYGVLLVIVMAAWFWLARKQQGSVKAGVAALTGIALALLLLVSWGLRNQKITGEFMVFSDHGKRFLWWVFHERGGKREPWTEAPLEDHGKIAVQESTEWIVDHPFDAVSRVFWRELSNLTPIPPSIVTNATNQMESHYLRWGYRVLTTMIHEFWLVTGLVALCLAATKMPLPLYLLGACTVARLLFPGILYTDKGRYTLILIPFLACCSIWFFGNSKPMNFSAYRKKLIPIVSAILFLQAVVVWRSAR